MRLINADDANVDRICCYSGGSCYLEDVQEWLDDQPTIDAEPVVRCRDCKRSAMWDDQLVCGRISDVMIGYYHGTIDVVSPDDFCSHGERREDE